MKRVLLLFKGLGRGGAEQLLVTAQPHLDTSRFDYQVAYLLPWKDALVGNLEKGGLQVRCLQGARGAGWIGRLRALVRDQGIDLVHAHSPYAAIGARVGLGLKTPRLVYTEHGTWDHFHRATYWGNLLTFQRNDHVFAVSQGVQSSMRYPKFLRFLHVPPIEVLYHGVDLVSLGSWGSTDGVRQELGIPEDALVVGTIANFRELKGHRYLIQAAAQIRRAVPRARFVLVGGGPLEAEVRRQARELGLDGIVVFAGYREDALRVASSFDLFVLPSVHEGFPIALLEAMALGKPVVVTRVGGVPEAIEDGRHGLLVSPRDPRALADAILVLLKNQPQRQRFGSAAKRRAAIFDIRKTVRRQEDVYQELLG
jgi:glycosyltransferase involved in cell wall biosynthesis